MVWLDAHAHLQDSRLESTLQTLREAKSPHIIITNGTSPGDWESVASLQGGGSLQVFKAYGVHPWKVKNLPANWESRLRYHLRQGAVSVGEIGLDNWIENADPDLQIVVLERQLALADEFNLVPTLHCLRAWDPLIKTLRAFTLAKGFLIHGFSGSKEVQCQLLDSGAHFSFSAYAADPRRKRMRAAIAYCPTDRLLTETDAPDMVPLPEICRYPLKTADGEALHHPMEIITATEVIAAVRATAPEAIRATAVINATRLFDLGISD